MKKQKTIKEKLKNKYQEMKNLELQSIMYDIKITDDVGL